MEPNVTLSRDSWPWMFRL